MADPNRLYAIQSGELVRSDDGGLHWNLVLDVDPFGGSEVAVAPSRPDVVYVSLSNGSILRSADGGATWMERAPVPNLVGTLALTVDPSDPDRLFANGGFERIYRSVDGAATWSQPTIDGTIPFAVAFAFDPVEPSTVYVATVREYERSLDGGATWTRVGEAGAEVRDLVAHPSQPGVLFAATDRGIERSGDGGETWSRVGGAAGPEFCQAVAVAPWDGDRLIAACALHLWTSADGGESWHMDPSPLADTYVPRIEAAGADPGAVYFHAASSGIVASFDGGATWALRTPRLGRAPAASGLLAPRRAGGRVFFGTFEGLFASAQPWKGFEFLEAVGATGVLDLAADPHSTRVYAATERGLLVSDDGALWGEIAPGRNLRSITVDPLHPGTLYSWERGTGLVRSTDGGGTWTRRGRYVRDCLASIEAHPTQEDTFFGTAVCCSRDTPRPCGGAFVTEDGWATRRRIFEGSVAEVAFRPPGTLFVGTGDQIFRSTDLGETWKRVGEEVEPGTVLDILVDPVDPQVVYAATTPFVDPGPLNLIRSEDGGETWIHYGEGAPDDALVKLAIDPRRPWFLYAATSRQGVWRLQIREIPLPAGPGGRPLHPLRH